MCSQSGPATRRLEYVRLNRLGEAFRIHLLPHVLA